MEVFKNICKDAKKISRNQEKMKKNIFSFFKVSLKAISDALPHLLPSPLPLLVGGVLLLQTKTFAAPGDGPVVQYSFEDASNLGKDSSSAGNNATNNGVTQTLGRVGKAAHFNGSNAALDLSAHASKLNLTEGTVSFWAKADADAPDFSSILAWGTSAPDGSTFDGGYI